jgi:hypothetical protein
MLVTLAQSLRSDLNHLIVVHLEKVMGPVIDEASIMNPSLPHITNHFDYGEPRVEHDFPTCLDIWPLFSGLMISETIDYHLSCRGLHACLLTPCYVKTHV